MKVGVVSLGREKYYENGNRMCVKMRIVYIIYYIYYIYIYIRYSHL